MAELKSISLLCKVLNLLYGCDVKVDDFKLARLNKTDGNIISTFWALLRLVINESSSSVANVKLHFAKLNYKRCEFYCLPEDESSGSRELLLALAWLISDRNVIEGRLRNELLESVVCQEFCSVASKVSSQEDSGLIEFETVKDYQDYILFMAGRINFNIKMIRDYNEMIMNLMAKVHKNTSNVSTNPQLSIVDMLNLKNPDLLKSYLNEFRRILSFLEIYNKWKSKEECFWNWMIPVVTEKNNITTNLINLKTFLNYLRAYIKQSLTKNAKKTNKLQMMDEASFPKCVYVPDSINLNEFSYTENKDEFEKIKAKESNTLRSLTEYLENFISMGK